MPQGLRSLDYSDLNWYGLPFCTDEVAIETTTEQREALVALYTATDGANWTHNDNWLSDAPISAWYNVTTDSSGRVTALNLGGLQLRGEIPGNPWYPHGTGAT